MQNIYTADPAPLVYGGRVYLYTGHDEDASTYFTMRDWRVYSSTDMVNWTDHGSPMSLATFAWADANAWAGQVVARNGKFYWYAPMRQRSNGQMVIGVAVSDSPTGPFRDAIGRPLVGNGQIDPTVMIDDDGQAYLYWGNPDLWYVRLNADMTSYSGSPTKIALTTAGFGTRTGDANRPTLFEEGPWVYKRNGLYYNVFAAKCCSEFLAYSTSPGPTGPWTYRGTVMPTTGSSFTNHPGVIDFNGGSYLFYHNGALPGGGGYTRSVAVEKFSYGADGSIPTINMTTAGRAAGGHARSVRPAGGRDHRLGLRHRDGAVQRGRDERRLHRQRRLPQGQGGRLRHRRGLVLGAGGLRHQRWADRGPAGQRRRLRSSARAPSPAPAAGRRWTTTTCPVTGASGTHDLYLRFTGGSGSLFNLNWWQFGAGGSTTPTSYRITNRNSGQVMDVQAPNLDDLAVIGQWSSNGTAWQQWRFLDAGSGNVRLQSVNSGKCVDITGASTADGAAVIQYTLPRPRQPGLHLALDR